MTDTGYSGILLPRRDLSPTLRLMPIVSTDFTTVEFQAPATLQSLLRRSKQSLIMFCNPKFGFPASAIFNLGIILSGQYYYYCNVTAVVSDCRELVDHAR